MTIEEAIKTLTAVVSDRTPVKFANTEDTWYFYTENKINYGKNLPVIENGYYVVNENSVLPITPLDIPKDLKFLPVPLKKRVKMPQVKETDNGKEEKFAKKIINDSEKTQRSKVKFTERIDDMVGIAAGKIIDTSGKVLEVTDHAKAGVKEAVDTVARQLDINGDGKVGIEDIIMIAIKTPGIHIDRTKFLHREFYKNHPQSVIEKVIQTTPALAGIKPEEIDKIADEVIKYERTAVSGISVALGMPGGVAMAATIPADIIQYYGYTLRAVQKLLYLYGFPEIETDEEGLHLDSETVNAIIVCLGIMNGVAGANNAIKAMAKALAVGVEKQLLKMALTKGAIFPVVRSIMKWFGVTLTKKLFTGAIKKTIPVVGGVVAGGVTFASFKPCCYRLKNVLQDTMLSNPSHISTEEEDKLYNSIITGEIIEAEFEDIPTETNTDSDSKNDTLISI